MHSEDNRKTVYHPALPQTAAFLTRCIDLSFVTSAPLQWHLQFQNGNSVLKLLAVLAQFFLKCLNVQLLPKPGDHALKVRTLALKAGLQLGQGDGGGRRLERWGGGRRG